MPGKNFPYNSAVKVLTPKIKCRNYFHQMRRRTKCQSNIPSGTCRDIRVILLEECDLLIPIFTSLSTSISRSISHSSFLLSIENTSPSLHVSHTMHQVLLLSPLLLVINYKVSRQFIMSCTRGKKKSTYIRPEVWICGTRHSTVVYWPSENTSQILLWCCSTVTRRAIYCCSMLCLV